tara:strand:- start:164 stop:598 length:435 start_codon:yes stop_codon:yes gene_type:complete
MDSLTNNFDNMTVNHKNTIFSLENEFNKSCVIDTNYISHERTKIGLEIYDKAVKMLEHTSLHNNHEFLDFFTYTKKIFIDWYEELFYEDWDKTHHYTIEQTNRILQIKENFELYFQMYDADVFQSLKIITSILYELFSLNDIFV